jgi:hypothetical protein
MSEAGNPTTEVDELLATFLDDELSDDQRRRLAELVQADPAARTRYLDHCRMHASLAWEHGVLGDVGFPEAPEEASKVVEFPRPWIRRLAVAAILVIGLEILWQGMRPTLRRNAWMAGETVGKVNRSAGGDLAVAGIGHSLNGGDALRLGDYELTHGFAEIELQNGVVALVESPARFKIESASLLALYAGRLSAAVPAEGVGFTVETPNAEVIDHGTEFAIEVTEDRSSEVHVFQGEVEVKPIGAGIDPVRLLADQATRLDGESSEPSGIAIAPDRFLRALDEPRLNYSEKIRTLKPVVYFRMNVPDDGSMLEDRSGNGHHGVVHRGSLRRPPFSPGRHGAALRLRGASREAHTIVPDYPKATNNQISVTAWVRADSRPRWASIAKNWAPGEIGQFHFGLYEDHGGLEVQIAGADGEEAQIKETKPFPLTEWQHVAFVADGNSLRLFRNGIEVAKGSHHGLAAPTLKALGIGAKPAGARRKKLRGPSGFWDGRIDELAIFNHALEAKTILKLYETEKPTGLVASK